MAYTGTPTIGLDVRRKIGWGGEDNILRFALTGNTVGVKSLLSAGKASMTDVDPNHGRTALYVSSLGLNLGRFAKWLVLSVCCAIQSD